MQERTSSTILNKIFVYNIAKMIGDEVSFFTSRGDSDTLRLTTNHRKIPNASERRLDISGRSSNSIWRQDPLRPLDPLKKDIFTIWTLALHGELGYIIWPFGSHGRGAQQKLNTNQSM